MPPSKRPAYDATPHPIIPTTHTAMYRKFIQTNTQGCTVLLYTVQKRPPLEICGPLTAAGEPAPRAHGPRRPPRAPERHSAPATTCQPAAPGPRSPAAGPCARQPG